MNRYIAAPLLVVFLTAFSIRADSPFQFGFWGPHLQIVSYEKSITGLRLDVFRGSNVDVTGLDIGVTHQTSGTGRGVQFSLANDTRGSQYGLQFGFINLANRNMSGLQLGIGYSHAGSQAKGIQLALVNHVGREDGVESKGSMSGLQLGVISQVKLDLTGFQSGMVYGRVYGKMSGMQMGLINQAGDASGLQLGIVNVADSMNGLQIGLWNQINSKEHLRILPIVNWSF